ncbi:MAG: exodeoxyribonuclease VII large subunit [Actinomycetia bacterium]|nr:exodeoxyribonuclease VII large subunit [Actinomycetes bacterium]
MDDSEALSVSDAMRLAKTALESVSVLVVGEVSECTVKPGYKAVYFTIRDESAVMPCLMWRDAYERSGVDLRPGMLVQVSGSFTVYAPKGRMQFQVRTMAPAGEGILRLQVAALARKLAAEGLMVQESKRPLPAYPSRIGVVTSPQGKAVHDVIRTLRRRYPVAEVLVAGVQVEGEGAAFHIVEGLTAVASAPGGVDVVILCRGGGSYEDLMPFNAEEVARAIRACPVAVVTGIGHEPDDTIADMVADVRASTPTAAAEAVAPSLEEVSQHLSVVAKMLARSLFNTVQQASHRVALLAQRPLFRDPAYLLGMHMQTVDTLADALARAIPERLRRDGERVAAARHALVRVGPRLLDRPMLRRDAYRARLIADAARVTEPYAQSMALAAARLDDLSPLAILGRGYAVCYDEHGGRVIRSSAEVAPGDRVGVRLEQGRIGCLVENTEMEARPA